MTIACAFSLAYGGLTPCRAYRVKRSFFDKIQEADMKGGGLSIGALSKQSGVNIETIRYYEKIRSHARSSP